MLRVWSGPLLMSHLREPDQNQNKALSVGFSIHNSDFLVVLLILAVFLLFGSANAASSDLVFQIEEKVCLTN